MPKYEIEKIQIIFPCLRTREKKLTIYYFLKNQKQITMIVYRDYESDLSAITRVPKSVEISEPLKQNFSGLL